MCSSGSNEACRCRSGSDRSDGLEAGQPLLVVRHALDRVTGLDEPVDELVHAEAVIVRVHHVVRLEAVLNMGGQGGDRLGDELDGQAVVVRALPVAVRRRAG